MKRFAVRFGLGSFAVIFFALSFSPYCLSVYFFSIASAVGLWRFPLAPRSLAKVMVEAVCLGTLMGWSITRFFTSVSAAFGSGIALHGLCCLIFSLQIVGMATAVWLTRSWSILTAAPVVALASVLGEMIQAKLVGLTWIGSNSILAFAPTPIAQWTSILPTFLFSYVLSWVACLWTPDFAETGYKRWRGLCWASLSSGILWGTGVLLEKRVNCKPLDMKIMLVQVHSQSIIWQDAHNLTINSLNRDGSVDLVIWPEGSLEGGSYSNFLKASQESDQLTDSDQPMRLDRFRNIVSELYETNCLIGIVLNDPTTVHLYGNNYLVDGRFNCGCLIHTDSDSSVNCHEKLLLMPISEYKPKWIDMFPKLRDVLFRNLDVGSYFFPGRNFDIISFVDRNGRTRNITVAICYESWFPWLPQYHCKEPLDAICHLVGDHRLSKYPEYTQRMLLTIRLRAIETRTWQLVCTHCSGTAVIDPRGRIVKQLPPGPGVLCTDQLE